MGWSPGCYIPSFMEIGCRFWRRFLKGFYHIYMGVVAILVMWPASCHQIFISFYPKAFIQSVAQIATIVSEKIQFEILYVHNLGPRSRNDLECQYSQIFIYSIRCLLPLTFRSLAAIVSDKIHCFHFFLWWAGVPNATYQVSWKSACRFCRRRFF